MIRLLAGLAVLLLAMPAAPAQAAPPAPAGVPLVTLGFDDGMAEQATAARLLEENGLRGTFYINSGRLDSGPGYLSTDQVRQLQDRGHEIAGHTVFHLHLTQQDPAEQARQVCSDRSRLLGLGLRVTNFAYPFGEYDLTTQRITAYCGYQSARRTSGVTCAGCPAAETNPPGDRYAMRAMSEMTPATTAADLAGAVRAAARAGSWLQLVLHHVCDAEPCAANAIRRGELTTFVRWLASWHRAGAVAVSTVQQVLRGQLLPVPASPAPTATRLAVQNGSLEQGALAPSGPLRCFQYTTSGGGAMYSWTPVADAHSGRQALRGVVTAVGTAITVVTSQDLGSCAPPVRAGRTYRIGVWYTATAPVRLIAYARQPQGNYRSFAASRPFPPASRWTLAAWTTKPVPDLENTALSIGFSVGAPGTYTLDDLQVAEGSAATTGRAVRFRQLVGASEPEPEPEPEPFRPPDWQPPVPVAAQPGRPAGEVSGGTSGGHRLTEILQVVAIPAAVFLLVLWLDRRFRRIHRRSQG